MLCTQPCDCSCVGSGRYFAAGSGRSASKIRPESILAKLPVGSELALELVNFGLQSNPDGIGVLPQLCLWLCR